MQLERGQYIADMIPAFSFIDSMTVLVEGGYYTHIIRISITELLDMKHKEEIRNSGNPIYGRPIYYAIGEGKDRGSLYFWPTPDAHYSVKMRYAPPLMEF